MNENMGAVTREQVETFWTRVKEELRFPDIFHWTEASPSICLDGHIYIRTDLVDKYPWEAYHEVLHETAHIDAKGHGPMFHQRYAALIIQFLAPTKGQEDTMTTDSDYLARIAARTVECKNLDCNGTGHITKYGGFDGTVPTESLCAVCLNTGRVLDSRFNGIRDTRKERERRHLEMYHSAMRAPSKCLGYTVVRDLGVLLEASKFALYWHLPSKQWHAHACDGSKFVADDTHLEAVAHALWNWLEAQESDQRPMTIEEGR